MAKRRSVNPVSNPDPKLQDEDPILDGSDRREPRQKTIFTISGNNENAVIPIIYGGPVRTGGILTFAKAWAAGDYFTYGALCIVYVIGWGPIQSITDITFGNDEPFSTFGIGIEAYTGNANTIPSYFTSPPSVESRWTSSLPGLAFVVAKFPNRYNSDYPDVDPHSFKCTVNGLLVRDPRAAFAASFSKNVALCRADFWTNRRYGAQRPDSIVDWDSVIEAADDCDHDIGGGKPRFQMALKIDNPMKFREWDKTIKRHAQMFGGFNAGKYQMFVDKARSDSGIHLTDQGTDNHIIDARFRLKDTTEVPNEVGFTYIDTANGFKEDTAKTQHPGIGTGAINEVISTTYDTKGNLDYDQAKRLSIWGFNRAQLSDKEYTISATYDGGIRCVPGLRIKITTSDLDWTAQDCLVTKVTRQGYGFVLVVEKYDENIYSDTPQTNPSVTPPSGPSPYDTVPDPEGLTLEEIIEPSLDSSAGVQAYVKASWTRPSAYIFYDRTRVTVTRTKAGETPRTWVFQEVKDGPILIPGSADGANYEVTLQTINTRNVLSAGATADIDTTDVFLTPEAPDELIYDGNYWLPPPIRTRHTFGSSFWSAANLTSSDFTLINNGVKTDSAVVFGAYDPINARAAVLDAGAPIEFSECFIHFATAYDGATGLAGDLSFFNLQYSDDGSVWTTVENIINGGSTSLHRKKFIPCDFTQKKFKQRIPSSIGAHRYWRLECSAGLTSPLAEVQFNTITANDYTYVKGYRIKALGTDGKEQTLDIFFQPDADRPNVFKPVYAYESWNALTNAGSGGSIFKIMVSTISSSGHISEDSCPIARWLMWSSAPATYGVEQDYLPLGLNNAALASGLNNDYPLTNIESTLRTSSSGATAIELTGLMSGYKGRQITIFNIGPADLILHNEHASSTAANRISLYEVSTLVIPPNRSIELFYDTVSTRWRPVRLEGVWTTFTPVRTASAGTWTGGTIITARYMLIGKTMTVAFYADQTSVSTSAAVLCVDIPGGFLANVLSGGPLVNGLNNGVEFSGLVYVSNYRIYLHASVWGVAPFDAAVNTTNVMFTVTFEIQ